MGEAHSSVIQIRYLDIAEAKEGLIYSLEG